MEQIMTDEELAERLIACTRSIQEEGVPLQSVTAGLLGLALTIMLEQHGPEAAAAHIHLMADRIAPSAVATLN